MNLRRSRSRRWQEVRWSDSLIFVVALILVTATVAFHPFGGGSSGNGAKTITFQLNDAVTGSPLDGVSVSIGGQALTTGADGTVELPVAVVDQDLVIQRSGYQTVRGMANSESPGDQIIALQPDPPATEVPPTEVPPTEVPPTEVPPTEPALVNGERFRGYVTNADGNPIADATVRISRRFVETDEDGRFSIEYKGGPRNAIISAPGYADQSVRIVASVDVTLERFDIKGVYLNGMAAGDQTVVDAIIAMIDQTELNAVVIDIKDGVVFYDSQIDFFREAGAVNPTYAAETLVQQFHDHGIYVIARQVAFKDPLVAETYRDLAIKVEGKDELWRGWAGEAWVNPLKKGLYQPNVDLAVEAAKLGFDEIQYDYIRFPDGDLKGADFGKAYDDVNKRIAAITTLLTMTRDDLRPLGVKLSADIFGWMLLVDDDQGIGQRLPDIVAVVDYVSPMVYPSHFPVGSVAVDGHPNDFPYETISIALSLGMERMPGQELKMRPWLQDFTLPDQTEYGPAEIRAEIDAAHDTGSSGWLVWNINAEYVVGAYLAEGVE